MGNVHHVLLATQSIKKGTCSSESAFLEQVFQSLHEEVVFALICFKRLLAYFTPCLV